MIRGVDWGRRLEMGAAWFLAFLWAAPLLYAAWAAFHSMDFVSRFDVTAPLTLDNFRSAWKVAPFARYFLNTFMLVCMTLAGQLVLCTLAAYAFARFDFPGKDLAFILVLIQIMIMP
ncbi:MAG: carbohydrate ABC transporter permease, partial [Hyphomicrobiales bacterium]